MAGDWIKVEHATLDKPEVSLFAELLGVPVDQGIGILLRFWVWMDRNARNGTVTHVTPSVMDTVMHCPGFSGAISAVGWAQFDDALRCVTVPNFDRHNEQSAKSRSSNADRQARYRLRKSNVTGVTQALPEKRREEKRNTKEPGTRKRGRPSDDQKKQEGRSKGQTFRQWSDAEAAAGRVLVRSEHPVWKFAGAAGIPREFVKLAWWRFKGMHLDGTSKRKRQLDWPATFANAVKDNWGRLWYFDEESKACALTTAGVQHSRAMEAEAAAERQPTNGSAPNHETRNTAESTEGD